MGALAHKPADDAINGGEDSAQENAIGDHFDFGEKSEAGNENNNGRNESDDRYLPIVGFEVFLVFNLGLVELLP